MKRKNAVIMSVLALLLCISFLIPLKNISALANSAAPIKPDDGSGIVFKQHEFVQIQSEVLDIIINDDLTANIVATYIMKNSSLESLSVETMFLTPVEYGENKNISVQKNGEELGFNQEFYGDYSHSDNKAQDIEDWESILESVRNSQASYSENQYVAAIVYYVDFEPNEQLELKVSYIYQLGTSGYRTTARLLYYLTPAKYWKNFADIEINLTLGEKYKALKSSSLKFDKVENKHYKFSAATLPNTELKIEVSDDSFASYVCSTVKMDKSVISGTILFSLFAILILGKKRASEFNAAIIDF